MMMKFTPVTLASLTVTVWLAGLKAAFCLLGVIVYDPLDKPEKLYSPEALVVVAREAAPLSVMVVSALAKAGLTAPEMVYVGRTAVAVKFTSPTSALLMVIAWLEGLKLYPLLLGVTAYLPFASPRKM